MKDTRPITYPSVKVSFVLEVIVNGWQCRIASHGRITLLNRDSPNGQAKVSCRPQILSEVDLRNSIASRGIDLPNCPMASMYAITACYH